MVDSAENKPSKKQKKKLKKRLKKENKIQRELQEIFRIPSRAKVEVASEDRWFKERIDEALKLIEGTSFQEYIETWGESIFEAHSHTGPYTGRTDKKKTAIGIKPETLSRWSTEELASNLVHEARHHEQRHIDKLAIHEGKDRPFPTHTEEELDAFEKQAQFYEEIGHRGKAAQCRSEDGEHWRLRFEEGKVW